MMEYLPRLILWVAFIAFFGGFAWCHLKAKNTNPLYLNALDALQDVENKLESFRQGIIPLSPTEAWQLLSDRRNLIQLIAQYEGKTDYDLSIS